MSRPTPSAGTRLQRVRLRATEHGQHRYLDLAHGSHIVAWTKSREGDSVGSVTMVIVVSFLKRTMYL